MHTAATNERKSGTFTSALYLQGLMAELDRASICRRIAEARQQAGLTQTELAGLLRNHQTGDTYSWRAVQTWERGQKDRKGVHRWVVPWDQLDEIAQACGVTRDWVLHGDETPAPAASVVVDVAAQLTDVLNRLTDVLLLLLEERRPND